MLILNEDLLKKKRRKTKSYEIFCVMFCVFLVSTWTIPNTTAIAKHLSSMMGFAILGHFNIFKFFSAFNEFRLWFCYAWWPWWGRTRLWRGRWLRFLPFLLLLSTGKFCRDYVLGIVSCWLLPQGLSKICSGKSSNKINHKWQASIIP